MRRWRTTAVLLGLLCLPAAVEAADSFIIIPTGQKIDTWNIGGVGGVERQRGQVCGTGATHCAPVDEQAGLYVNPRRDDGTEIFTTAAPGRVDPTGTTSQPVIGTLSNNGTAASTSQLPVLPAVATAAVPSHTEGRGVNLSVGLDGILRVTVPEAGKVARRVKTAGGANQDATQVGTGAKVLYFGACSNGHATTDAWAHFYNVASPTSASTPIVSLYMPAKGGQTYKPGPDGADFATALSVRFVTTNADSSTSAMASADGICNFVTSN
jgi:hypothetical protein